MKAHSRTPVLNARELIHMALLTGVLFASKLALAWMPNVELVSLLLLLYTLHYGRRTLYIIYAFAFIELLLYGMGSLFYLYVWTVWYLVIRLCRCNQSTLVWALLCGSFGLFFGAMCSIPYFIAGGPAAGIAYFVAGIPYDLIHFGGNLVLTMALFPILNRLPWDTI